jgi:hypothetical protein
MRDWWLRAALVLQRPRPVFVALRDDSKDSLADRAEPVLAIVLLAGIAAVLASSVAGRLMNDSSYDGLLVAVWAFIAGGLYGMFGYYAFGALLHGSAKALGSQGSYRRARHVVAFAAVPIALSLVILPVKLAVYGESLFRTGGSDHGTGVRVFDGLELLLVGVRAVHGWTWARAAAASSLVLAAAVFVGLTF